MQFPGLPDTYKIPPQSTEYNAETTYEVDQYCVYRGQTYRCIQTAINRIPTDEPTYWELVTLSDDIYYFKNKIENQIAEPFSPSKSYVIGNYVEYENDFYKFVINHPSAAWNPAHVVKRNVAQELKTSGSQSTVQLGTITLSTNWIGTQSPRYQVVTIPGITITANSKVDIQLSIDQLASLQRDSVQGFIVENDNTVLTVYCIGGIPSEEITLQCTVVEAVPVS